MVEKDCKVSAEPSPPKSELENELPGTNDLELSEDWRRTPTTPTSRLIAPTDPEDLESGDGTWTGSVEEEYTPIAELLDATIADCDLALLAFPACTREATLENVTLFSSDTSFLTKPVDSISWAVLRWESDGPYKPWDEFLLAVGFSLLELPVELIEGKKIKR